MRSLERLEPLWWALFSLGGTLAAFLLPVHVFLNNIAMPLGWLRPEAYGYAQAARLAGHPAVKAYLAVFIVAGLFHAAHRLRLLPHELLLPAPAVVSGYVAYLIAALLSAVAISIIILAP